MREQTRTFKGGYKFRTFEGTPAGPVEDQQKPGRVIVPFSQGQDQASDIAVDVGATVSAGQVLARPMDAEKSPVHSSIAGTVKELSVRNGEKLPWAAVIESGGQHDLPGKKKTADNSSPGKTSYAEGFPPGGNRDILLESGLGSILPDDFFNCDEKAGKKDLEILVVSCIQTAPLLPGAGILYASRGEAIARGALIILEVLAGKEVVFALGKRDKQLGEAISSITDARIFYLPEVYPQEDETLLLKAIPYIQDKETSFINGQVALAAHNAVVLQEPMTRIIVSIGGSALKQPVILNAFIGTPVQELVAPYLKDGIEARYITGDFLTGKSIPPDYPLTRNVESITVLPEDRERRFLSFMRPGAREDSFSNSFLSKILSLKLKNDTNIHGEYRPCINCGWCEQVCPSGLMPDLLMKLLRIDELEEAEMLNIMACIDCGLCSYVCPAKLPLFEELIAGKKTVQKELNDA